MTDSRRHSAFTLVELLDLLAGGNLSLPNPIPLLQTPIPAFLCPSDTNSDRPLVPQQRHFG